MQWRWQNHTRQHFLTKPRIIELKQSNSTPLFHASLQGPEQAIRVFSRVYPTCRHGVIQHGTPGAHQMVAEFMPAALEGVSDRRLLDRGQTQSALKR
jgi:hypothetical protein